MNDLESKLATSPPSDDVARCTLEQLSRRWGRIGLPKVLVLGSEVTHIGMGGDAKVERWTVVAVGKQWNETRLERKP